MPHHDLPFDCEYAKSGRSSCKGCKSSIAQGSLRLGIMIQIPHWYHPRCFWPKAKKLQSEGDIHGFDSLRWKDQEEIRTHLPGGASGGSASVGDKRKSNGIAGEDEGGPSSSKKSKTANGSAGESAESKLLKQQSEDIWKIRDKLERHVTKRDMAELLECNDQEIPSGESKILDRLSDCMLFGALKPCTQCKTGQFVYSTQNNAYVCTGNLTEFTKCSFQSQDPPRKPFIIPEDLTENEYLSGFKYKSGRKRVFPTNKPAPSAVSLANAASAVEVIPAGKPLHQLSFAIAGKHFQKDKKGLTAMIKSLGGSVAAKVEPKTVAVISTEADLTESKLKPIKEAQLLNVAILNEAFLENVKEGVALPLLASQHSLVASPSLASDLHTKIETVRHAKSTKSMALKAETAFTKSVPKSMKYKLKGGAVVDPDSGLEDKASVLVDKNGNIFTAVLSLVDLQSGANSYYKLQVLKHDSKDKFWVFRAWGRVGTTIGGNKLESMDRQSAIDHFKSLFLEKTGNRWEDRANFVKYPSRFCLLDIDYGENDEDVGKTNVAAGTKSKLAKPIQALIQMIFDVQQMKETMKEFEIDLKKMPLGKISQSQIQKAYRVLSELQELMKTGATEHHILDASNRFYTMIPHDFGMQKPPLLATNDIIQIKVQMLDCLNDIQIAYGILKSDSAADAERDPIDVHYEKLHTEIEVLDKKSKEFQRIVEYAQNTHAATHQTYTLEIEEVFKISREGEEDRFTPFKKLPNHMLLWHGSRTSNFAGIIAQGLKIAPPEAPSTGYMFGKGIYFADMVSKSANYCFTSRSNPTGLLLLCDVALGQVYEKTAAEYVEKLPKGKHSTKGLGKTAPDPAGFEKTEDGVIIPMGKGVPAGPANSTLLYNEYIVYDIAQVNQKYLVKTKFNYK